MPSSQPIGQHSLASWPGVPGAASLAQRNVPKSGSRSRTALPRDETALWEDAGAPQPRPAPTAAHPSEAHWGRDAEQYLNLE